MDFNPSQYSDQFPDTNEQQRKSLARKLWELIYQPENRARRAANAGILGGIALCAVGAPDQGLLILTISGLSHGPITSEH